MSDQAQHQPDEQLGDALAANRQRIVTRVLTRCGYSIDRDPTGAKQPPSDADSFADTESRLLRSGLLRWRGPWFRRRCARNCPSPWSLSYWRGLLRRRPGH